MGFEIYLQRLDERVTSGTLDYAAFRRIIKGFYRAHGRSFAWRTTFDPYHILVSEIMLQQTQTSRVQERFPLFLKRFPTIRALAKASQADVIAAWEGLGYYRRARNLHRAAQAVCESYNGEIPSSHELLEGLPGIGAYTAAALSVFAFETPRAMLETNIRDVYLYSFFANARDVTDSAVLDVVEASMDTRQCREWFYALMDFGVELKRARPGINRQSKHHAKQSKFEGSDRQIAARVLRYVVKKERGVSVAMVTRAVELDEARVQKAIERLIREGLLAWKRAGVLQAR